MVGWRRRMTSWETHVVSLESGVGRGRKEMRQGVGEMER